MRTLAAGLVLVAAAWGQDQARQDRATDFWVNRMKDRLKLTDEQTTRVREVFSKDADDRAKMDEARTAKVNEILTEEQKKLYEEMRRGQGGPGGRAFQFQGGQGGGFGRGFGGLGQLNIDDLKRELSLTDEQAQKIAPIVEEYSASVRKRVEEFRGGGFNFQNFNFNEEIQKFQDGLKQVSEKIKAHLTDEQKTKLDGLTERVTGWTRFLPQLGGGAGGGLFGGRGGPGGRQSVDERVRRAMEALKVEKEDERTAIEGLVRKVVQAQADLEEYQRTSRDRLQETSRARDLSDQAVEDRIREVQEERRRREKEIAGLQKELSEVVTNRQEVELMVLGILR
jgi:hypothetical protein